MSLCVEVANYGLLQAAEVHADLCESYLLLSVQEYKALQSVSSFDWSLLEFDQSLYEYVVRNALVSFIVGHCLGRVLKLLGKI